MAIKLIQPDGDTRIIEHEGPLELDELQKLIGGYITVVNVDVENEMAHLIVDEEGLLKQLPINETASEIAKSPLVGNALLLTDEHKLS